MVGLQLLILLIVANGTPVIAHHLLGRLGAMPIDAGRQWFDGYDLFGPSKTWRGLFVGTLATALVGPLIGLGLVVSACFGLLALMGDLISSFIKRRFSLRPSARFTGLDQIPEALLPVAVFANWLNYGVLTVLVVVGLFMAINMAVSPLLFRIGLRRQPH